MFYLSYAEEMPIADGAVMYWSGGPKDAAYGAPQLGGDEPMSM